MWYRGLPFLFSFILRHTHMCTLYNYIDLDLYIYVHRKTVLRYPYSHGCVESTLLDSKKDYNISEMTNPKVYRYHKNHGITLLIISTSI